MPALSAADAGNPPVRAETPGPARRSCAPYKETTHAPAVPGRLVAFALIPAATARGATPTGYIVVLESGTNPSAVAAEHAQSLGVDVNFVYRHALKGYAGLVPAAAVDDLRSDTRVAAGARRRRRRHGRAEREQTTCSSRTSERVRAGRAPQSHSPPAKAGSMDASLRVRRERAAVCLVEAAARAGSLLRPTAYRLRSSGAPYPRAAPEVFPLTRRSKRWTA